MADADSNCSRTDSVEEWRDIPGYSRYQVSSIGRVRSRTSGKWRLLKPGLAGNRAAGLLTYPTVCLSLGHDLRRTFYVHALVAEAFIGPRPNNYEVNHVDGVKGNNVVSNLEYVSRSENELHGHRIGLKKGHNTHGEQSPRAKLTQEQADRIRYLCQSSRIRVRDLARMFDVSRDVVRRILMARIYLDSPGGKPQPIDSRSRHWHLEKR